MPGAWTVIEEYRSIDLLAISAWSSQGQHARVGYEVKVSRSDLRRELLRPGKRASNVEWCNQFYFAVPAGMLTADELAFREPPEFQQATAFAREPCPARCYRRRRDLYSRRPADRLSGHYVRDPDTVIRSGDEWQTCETCGGAGHLELSLVEREAPHVWVPPDVGLIVVDGRGSKVVRPSTRRPAVPQLTPAELGPLVRWVSMRPDPRHHPARAVAEAAVQS